MKKLLFSAVNLDVGGIEKALVTLLNYLADQKDNNLHQEHNNKYEITLVLEKKQGLFLDALNTNIKVMEYTPNTNKMVPIRKLCNLFKQLNYKRKYANKFDFSCSYATYSLPASFVARTASRNSALWCHMDYLEMFRGDKKQVKQFFEEKHYKEFRHIVCVSQESKDSFLEVFPEEKEKTIYINNLIDYDEITKKSCENIEEKNIEEMLTNKDITTFINIGRHDENQKKLSRIIEATQLLKYDKNRTKEFRILFIGNGQDSNKYEKMVKKYDLENEILFLGRKKNPYPYLKLADCTILTSDYEGYPVTFVESMVLNKPIITTNVSGVEAIKKEQYAIITDKSPEKICEKMNKFIENGFEIKNKFNPEKYNKEILLKLEKLF